VDAISSALNRRRRSLKGSQLLILGVAYKKDIDDLRESPALTIIELLQKAGRCRELQTSLFSTLRKDRKYKSAA